MKNCPHCEKQLEEEDIFHIDYTDMINPFTGELSYIEKDLCLSCYRQKVLNLTTAKAEMPN